MGSCVGGAKSPGELWHRAKAGARGLGWFCRLGFGVYGCRGLGLNASGSRCSRCRA